MMATGMRRGNGRDGRGRRKSEGKKAEGGSGRETQGERRRREGAMKWRWRRKCDTGKWSEGIDVRGVK